MAKNKRLKNSFLTFLSKNRRTLLLMLIGTYALVALFISLSFLIPPFKVQTVGEISKSTVSSLESFTYYDQTELKNILTYIRSTQPYLYLYEPEKTVRTFNNLDQFLKILRIDANSELVSEISKKGYQFSESTLFYLRDHHKFMVRYQNRFRYILKLLFGSYYIANQYPPEGLGRKIRILTPDQGRKKIQQRVLLLAPVEKNLLEFLIKKTYPRTSSAFQSAVAEILVNSIEPNSKLDTEARNREIQKELEKSSLQKSIRKGEILIHRDHVINQESFIKLQAYLHHLKSQRWSHITLNLILSLVLYIFLIYRFINYESEMIQKKRNIILALFFFVLANFLYFIAPYFRRVIFIPEFLLIPFSMLVFTLPFVITKVRSAIILLISYSFFILFYPGVSIISFLNLLILALSAIYTQKLIKKRYDYFTVSALVGVVNLFFAVLFAHFEQSGQKLSDWALMASFSFGISFTAAMFSLGLLPLLEHLFNIPTRFRLLELSNVATGPLLRELRKKAAGTYNHSILIGDMCSEAAETIGIDPLLVRVGGYYHDIGKMINPSYFIENQGDKNKHDDVKPTISVSMIKSHVKLGVDLALKNHIPTEIIDFIREHHGTTPISYFYHQALGLFGDENVKIEDYEYPGPKPQSKETAILLIADAVEATVRSYATGNEKVSLKKIRDVIDNVVENRLEQGQFDFCNITLREIHTISEVFFRYLASYYHKRIDYRKNNKNSES